MVEQAKHEVLKEIRKIVIRRYHRLVVARVDGYSDGAFNLLFHFITGNNRQKSDIAMTAPVVLEEIAMTAPVLSETGSLAFIMPEGFRLETTADPVDNRAEIVEIPERVSGILPCCPSRGLRAV